MYSTPPQPPALFLSEPVTDIHTEGNQSQGHLLIHTNITTPSCFSHSPPFSSYFLSQTLSPTASQCSPPALPTSYLPDLLAVQINSQTT